MLASRITEVIGVVDAASAVVLGIHEDDDMLIGCACQYVMQLLQMQRRQITVAVEGVEVGTESGLLPDAL